MTEAQKKYKKEVKSKIITFYKHENDLLDFANSINFQKYVKQCLKVSMLKRDGFIYANVGNLKDFQK